MKNKEVDDIFRKYKSILNVPAGFGKMPLGDKIKRFNQLAKSKNPSLSGFVKEYTELRSKDTGPSGKGGKGGKGGVSATGKKKEDYKQKPPKPTPKAGGGPGKTTPAPPKKEKTYIKNKYGTKTTVGKAKYKPPETIGGEKVHTKGVFQYDRQGKTGLPKRPGDRGSGPLTKAEKDMFDSEEAYKFRLRREEIERNRARMAPAQSPKDEAHAAAADALSYIMGNHASTGVMGNIERLENPSLVQHVTSTISGVPLPKRPEYHWSQEGSRGMKSDLAERARLVRDYNGAPFNAEFYRIGPDFDGLKTFFLRPGKTIWEEYTGKQSVLPYNTKETRGANFRDKLQPGMDWDNATYSNPQPKPLAKPKSKFSMINKGWGDEPEPQPSYQPTRDVFAKARAQKKAGKYAGWE